MRTARLVAATAVLAAGIAIHPARAAAPDPGSLVRTTVQSQVGVVLDEIPASLRNRAAARPDREAGQLLEAASADAAAPDELPPGLPLARSTTPAGTRCRSHPSRCGT